MMNEELLGLFNVACQGCKANRRNAQIMDVVEMRRFEDQSAEDFLRAYVYVIVNSGMKNAVAEAIFARFVNSGLDSSVIGHLGKRKAVDLAKQSYRRWFSELVRAQDKVAYLDGLPWIGSVTKFHLARNLGIDVAKPDRHLIRLAKRYGYGLNVQQMCREISENVGLRIGTVDFVLWCYMAKS